jgi:hypothetical protein
MKKKQQEIVYQGIWPGIGKIYNIRVENGYTAIIIKSGEDVKKRSDEIKKIFVAPMQKPT